ncbi:MAG TPA: hypothetical protein VLB89_03585 [Gaiellaceae bacterium]|nr:hypothetical protein [Gaiellaceae bacterium]
MGQGRIRLLVAMAAGVLAVSVTGTAGAATSCGSRLIADWRDGRIDNTYPIACYRQALGKLPEDVRVYSSAQADITRALQARLSAAPKAKTSHHSSAGVSPLLVVAITAGALVAAGSVAAVFR